MGGLPPVFIEFLGNATGFMTTARGVKTELKAVEAQGGGNMSKLGGVSKAALMGIGVAAGVAAIKTVHMAADFQTAMTRVQTGAGESASKMGLVSQGVLSMAGQVGQSTGELAKGLYMVESAGYHGQKGLDMLKIAAMGAKVGVAQLPTVVDAVTTAMNAYSMQSSNVAVNTQRTTDVMNALVATEASGKTNMEALAGSMSKILPAAASAHVGMNEVLGAMATMTMQGTSADVAATYLRQTIGQLSNPTAKAATTMKGLGLESTKVAQNLGKNGLASTLNMLTDAIAKKMGPGGLVLIDTLKKASTNTTAYQKVLANLPPAQKTYIGALATMVGGTKSMMAALQLSGPHMKTFQDNVKKIGDNVKKGGKGVEGWAAVQGTFNQKMAQAKASVEALAIGIGNKLLPYATKFAGWLAQSAGWLTKHKSAIVVLAAAIGGVLVIGLAAAAVAAWNFTAAMLANPVVWIIVGIVALIAALVLLIMHWRAVWNFIKDASKAIGGAVVGAWNWIASETAHIWDSYIVGPIKSAWRAVSAFFASAWHAVADPIVGAWHWISSVTSSVWNGISGFFRKWWPLLFVVFFTPIAVLVALWNHTHQAMFAAAKTVWNAVSGFFKEIWQLIVAGAMAIWTPIASFFSALWHGISSVASAIWRVISGVLRAEWNVLSTTARTLWNLISHYIITPIASVVSAVKSKMSEVANAVISGAKSALNFVSHIWGTIVNVGRDIVNGIISGVKSAGSALFDSLKNLASGALNAAKSFLGINSPSRVFANVVGKSIPEGIAKGISDHAHVAHNAVSSMAATLTGGFNGSLSSGISAGLQSAQDMASGALSGLSMNNSVQLSGAGAGGATYNTVNVNVQGSVRSDRDLRDVVQQEVLKLNARNRSNGLTFKR